MTTPRVRAVVFDVGETLVSEWRSWTGWAEWLDVPPLTFLGALGSVIARGGDHRDVFQLFRPGFDLRSERERRARAGVADDIRPGDLYADALPALVALRDAGYLVGVAGNQPESAEALFRMPGIDVDLVTSSQSLGVAKPEPAFFSALAGLLAMSPSAIAYVGDRIDNDVRPAAESGMRAVFLRRGPWAWIQAGLAPVPEAAAVIDDLSDIVAVVAGLDARPRRGR